MHLNRSPRCAALLLALTAFAGCSSEADESEVVVADAPAAGAAEGMEPAMAGMAQDTLGPQMEAHLATVQQADAQQLKALVPEHSRLVNALIDECRAMMRQMNMQPPAAFTELEEALRADLTRMEQLPPEQLLAFMPEHRERLQTMMQMRHDMMM